MDPNARPRSLSALAALILTPALFIALSIVRAWHIAEGVGNYTSCRNCFWLATFGHDAWLLAILLGALALANVVPGRGLRFVLRLVAASLLAAFAADIGLDAFLSSRLHFGDVLRFGSQVDADLSVVLGAFRASDGFARSLFFALVLIVVVGLLAASGRRPALARVYAIGALASLAFSAFALSRPVRYVNDLFTYNFVEANLPHGRLGTFSPPFLQAQRDRLANIPQICSKTDGFGGDVVIVLVESLSAWQSNLLGSGVDWTPELDAIAQRNHYFTHFYANGFTTSTGEISVITGRPPLPPAGEMMATYDAYAAPRDTLPDIAHRSGRDAAFFTPADLSFLGLGPWLQKLGFDVVGSSRDAFYDGMKRWQFGAAADGALYDRFLDWLDHRAADARPTVSMLETVSTHPPFVDPRSGKIDPEQSFRYADAEIGRLYRELDRRGFFAHGILMILGDHRTMTPLHADEYRDYGERAFARIPLVVAGAVDMPAVIDAPFQQTDIAPSLAAFVGLEACTSAFAGDFLRKDPKPADYVLHVRGDDRDRLDVYTDGDRVSGFRYGGDGSRWIDAPPPGGDDAAAWIDVHRARP